MFPDAKFGIGPAIEDGFYYDFELRRSLTPEDLPVIEKKMGDLIRANLPFNYKELSKEEAKQIFSSVVPHCNPEVWTALVRFGPFEMHPKSTKLPPKAIPQIRNQGTLATWCRPK